MIIYYNLNVFCSILYFILFEFNKFKLYEKNLKKYFKSFLFK